MSIGSCEGVLMFPTYCSAVEVFGHAENQCFTVRDALGFVAPFPSNLDGSFDRFSSSVHGKNHVEVEVLCDKLGKSRENVIVKSP